MSHFEVKKITCPHCNKQQNINVYCAVNVIEKPKLREDVLSKNIFYRKCKHCSGVFELRYPMLYNDIENNFMVYYIPDIENSKIIDKELENEYPELSSLRKRIVPDFDLLKEKILIFEAGLDDMALEIAKIAVYDAVKSKLKDEVTRVGFSFCHRDKNTMGFVFESENEPYFQSTRLEIYDKAKYIVNKTVAPADTMTGFLKIDREWADNILYRFKQRQLRKTEPVPEEASSTLINDAQTQQGLPEDKQDK